MSHFILGPLDVFIMSTLVLTLVSDLFLLWIIQGRPRKGAVELYWKVEGRTQTCPPREIQHRFCPYEDMNVWFLKNLYYYGTVFFSAILSLLISFIVFFLL